MCMRTTSAACPITIVPRSIEVLRQPRNIVRTGMGLSDAAVPGTHVTLSMLREVSVTLPPANRGETTVLLWRTSNHWRRRLR